MSKVILRMSLLAFALAISGNVAAADGKALYATTCIACHGANGQGTIPGVPDLKTRLAKSDPELVSSILKGFQSKGSPMAMPPKGGNPALTEADAAAIVLYLRTMVKP